MHYGDETVFRRKLGTASYLGKNREPKKPPEISAQTEKPPENSAKTANRKKFKNRKTARKFAQNRKT